MTAFSSLGLGQEIIAALTQQGYEQPTPIQAAAIPKALAGHDLLAAAQTGTGKTAAFMLPSLERLKRYANSSTSPAMHPVRMLVLTPTRELADQIEHNTQNYIGHLPLRHTVLFGGVNMDKQTEQLRAGCEIVIATVGRLLDHVKQKNINLNKVEIVVLDEADRMLDMGFIDDIRAIMHLLPKQRQTLLFSATFAPAIRKLAQDFMNSPEIVEVAAQNTTNSNVEQYVISVDSHRKRELLERLIVDLAMPQVIVFCKTKNSADLVARDLARRELSVQAIHGDKSQQHRTETLQQFKEGNLRILVATDVAARGLDIAELPFVINYEFPSQAEDYVHRIGRTGRAGADGVAISMMDETEQKMYEWIKELTGNELPISRIEGFEPRWENSSEINQNNQINQNNINQDNLDNNLNNNKDNKDNQKNKPKKHNNKPSLKPLNPINSNSNSNSNQNNNNKELASAEACSKISGRQNRRRGKERRSCALLQPNFGVK